MNRRGFLKFFGIGAAVATVSPFILTQVPDMSSRIVNRRLDISGLHHCILRPCRATGMAVTPGECMGIVGMNGNRILVRGA